MGKNEYGPLPNWYNQKAQDAANDAEYEREFETGFRRDEPLPKSILKFIKGLDSHMLVLDYGCGDGRLLIPSVQRGISMIGVDRSPKAVRETRRRLKEKGLIATVLKRNFYNMDFPAELFNAAFACQTLPYAGCWSKIKEAFDNLVKVLKPDASLYIRVRSDRKPSSPRYIIEDDYGNDKIVQKGTIGRTKQGAYKHDFSKEELRFLAETYGMEIIYIRFARNRTRLRSDGSMTPITWQWVCVMRKKD